MWNEQSFAKLSEIVSQCMESKVSNWWSENFVVMTILKHVTSAAVMEFMVILH